MRTGGRNEDLSEDYCFECKDGGEVRACDFRSCLKSYHPHCVHKDDSFLESDEHWTCGWHTCFICNKSSTYQCYCCPRSTCDTCFKEAQFVSVKTKTKGFCNKCLWLAILIEENKDVDSEGEKVDFDEAYESLFKDYWDLVKDKEGITLIDLHAANARLKSGEKCKVELGPPEGDKLFEVDGSEDYFDDEVSFLSDWKEGKPNIKKRTINKCKSNRRVFNGWGSEELLKFLESISKDIKEPLTQLDVCDIIKGYIEEKNLYQHDGNKKKKYVVCDERLNSLFRKKKLKQHRIYPLLQSHIAANNISDEEFFVSSEEVDETCRPRKKQGTNFDSKSLRSPNTTRGKSYASRSHYVSIVEKNIKSVYLKRSLVVDLLKDSISFEDQVIGCFVRVKSDQKDLFASKKAYWLGRVTGVKKVQQPYKIGEMSTDTVLSIFSIMSKDIPISMLSDEDFVEEECEDLRRLVKKNLFKRPTVAELEEKIRNVHAVIINHWIAKEIVKLQKLIDRANEKGWRKELLEYIDKRELLLTSGERQRLLKEIPEVIADICENENVVASALKEERAAKSIENATEERIEENLATPNGNALERIQEEVVATSDANAAEEIVTENEVKSHEIAEERIEVSSGNDAESNMNNAVGKRIGENGAEPHGNAAEAAEEMLPTVSGTHTVEVIDIDDDDDDDNGENPNPLIALRSEATNQSDYKDKIWHYFDPEGNMHGPFNMPSLIFWQSKGYFDDNFKVWRAGQSPKEAILLTNAFNLCH